MGEKRGNLYFECNAGIKARGAEARAAMVQIWGTYVHYTLAGLSKLPDFAGVGYRGLPDKADIIREYKLGRPIQWGSFTSIATGASGHDTAKQFADTAQGIILKITITCGKHLGIISFFPREGEVVVSPMSKFIVTSEPYEVDGYTFIDLI